MSELFEIEESKSPRLAWLEKHGIKVSPSRTHGPSHKHWMAYRHNEDFISASGYGETEDEAVVSLAVKLGIRLWNEEI